MASSPRVGDAERLRAWRKRNPEKVKAQQRAHRQRHKEALVKKRRAYMKANPEKAKIYAEREAERRKTPQAKEARRQYGKAYYQSAHGRSVVLCQCAGQRARRKGLEFSITPEWVKSKIDAGRCEVTGIAFRLDGDCDSSRDPWAPSLDRTDPRGGYTPENVKVVVCIYNFAKSDFSAEDVMKMCAAILDGKADRP